MLSGTPFEVVAEFFPSFNGLTSSTPSRCSARCRPPSSAGPPTGSPRSATAASCTTGAGLDPAGVRGRRPHGHPRAARPGQRRPRPAALRGRRASRPAVTPRRTSRSSRSVRRRPRPCTAVVHAAFEARPPLDPPAAALAETQEQLEERLAAHGGLLARVDGTPAGALVLDPVGGTMYLRRFGVVPDQQGHGVAAALIDAAVEAAEGYDDLDRRRARGAAGHDPVLGAAGVPRDPPRAAERRAAPPAPHRGLPGARRRGDARPRPLASPASWLPVT